MDKNLIMLEAKKELARREFFYFCHLSAPSFYKTDRKFLVRLCNEMQSFYESDEDALIINLPARAVLRQCSSNGYSAEIKVRR